MDEYYKKRSNNDMMKKIESNKGQLNAIETTTEEEIIDQKYRTSKSDALNMIMGMLSTSHLSFYRSA